MATRSQLIRNEGAVSVETALYCLDPSRTVQSQKEEADINTIVRNFGLTGHLPQGVRVPSYIDYEDVTDFQSALAAITAAEKAFMQFPHFVRARFDNDPARFVDFCSDARNLEEMRALGLAVPAKQEAPVVAPQGAPNTGTA